MQNELQVTLTELKLLLYTHILYWYASILLLGIILICIYFIFFIKSICIYFIISYYTRIFIVSYFVFLYSICINTFFYIYYFVHIHVFLNLYSQLRIYIHIFPYIFCIYFTVRIFFRFYFMPVTKLTLYYGMWYKKHWWKHA